MGWEWDNQRKKKSHQTLLGRIRKYLPSLKTRPWWSVYEHIVFNLDILVPEPDPEKIEKPENGFVQEVHYHRKVRWRPVVDKNILLSDYLKSALKKDDHYYVAKERVTFLPVLDNHSKFAHKWDILMILLLAWTAIVIPFQAAFSKSEAIDIMFLLDRIVDVLFLFDMFIQCLRPYQDPSSGSMVRSHAKIFKKYAKGWLLIDFASVFPFELLAMAIEQNQLTNLSLLRLLRFLRLSRLLKLFRLLRASRKLKELKGTLSLRFVQMHVLKLSLTIIIAIHWLACAFKLAGEKTVDSDPPGWIDAYVQSRNETVHSVWQIYMVSMYWSSSKLLLATPTNAVYEPSTEREYIFMIIANLAVYWFLAYIISTVVDVLAVANKEQRAHEKRADQYMQMFERLHLQKNLRNRVHAYWDDFESVGLISGSTKLLQDLPPQLRAFITVNSFIPMLERIPFIEPFLAVDPVLMQELATGVEICAYPPHSNVTTEGYKGIYFLERGIVSVDGAICVAPYVFGLTCLRVRQKKLIIRSLTFVTMHILPLCFLRSTFEKYPAVKKYARRWTSWETFRLYLREYGKLYYEIAKIGPLQDPPLISHRPLMTDDEKDDIDLAVEEIFEENGF